MVGVANYTRPVQGKATQHYRMDGGRAHKPSYQVEPLAAEGYWQKRRQFSTEVWLLIDW